MNSAKIFNAEDAEVGAEERGGGFSLRPLREPSRPLRLGLGTVWLRLCRLVTLRMTLSFPVEFVCLEFGWILESSQTQNRNWESSFRRGAYSAERKQKP